MQRGEIWWAEFDEPRPVVLIDGDEASGFQAAQIVPASGVDISGLGIEVPLGPIQGLPYEGVVRLGFPNPDFLFCTWLTTITAQSLTEYARTLPPERLAALDEALRDSRRERQPSPEATARLNEIRNALRRGEFPAPGRG